MYLLIRLLPCNALESLDRASYFGTLNALAIFLVLGIGESRVVSSVETKSLGPRPHLEIKFGTFADRSMPSLASLHQDSELTREGCLVRTGYHLESAPHTSFVVRATIHMGSFGGCIVGKRIQVPM